ncbi:HD domain-containing protein [Robinsoniella peoriensis]|uniref:HD domain-containing protein n=1 Tax=Robinsoniella peoriensis TaxID=180332 RepID=UPI003750C203
MNQREIFLEMQTHMIEDENPSSYLNEMYERGFFKDYPFQMLYELRNTEQSPIYHPEGNVWIHTMQVIDVAAKVRKRSRDPRVFMWAALLHDIGKPSTTRMKKGRITSYNHDQAGEQLAREFLSFFDEDNNFIEAVCGLVRYHMQILFVVKGLPHADLEGMKKRTDLQEVALLGLCDRLGRDTQNKEEEEKNIRLFIKKCLDD